MNAPHRPVPGAASEPVEYPAMDYALRRIARECSHSALLKDRVRAVIRLSVRPSLLRARYGVRAEMFISSGEQSPESRCWTQSDIARLNQLELACLPVAPCAPNSGFDSRDRGQSLLDQAIAQIERWYRTERKAFQIASVFGRPRLSLEILTELRLITRWMRFKNLHAQFPAIVARVGE